MGRNKDRDQEKEKSLHEKDDAKQKDEPPPPKRKKVDENATLTTKTGGAYIPPAKLRMMQEQMTDKTSEQYQRLSWEALKKSINGLINKVNVSNIKDIVRELFQENIVRGRGLVARSITTAQNASPTFTHVYAALVAIINSRFPQNGELILRRVVAQFRRSYRRNQKDTCLHSAQFVAHLLNQQVAHEILGLQVLTLLLETPTDDSVEVAIGFLKECGQKLGEVTPRGLVAVFERLRVILHEEKIEKRVQYMIEVMFAIRKDGFKEHPSVIDDLALVDESDQFTHMLTLDDDNIKALESEMNVFRVDPDFQQSEENYKKIKKDILDESSEGSGSSGSSSSESEDEEEEEEAKVEITDQTETNLVALRRTIYLAVQSSLSFEECAHKILKMEFEERDYPEICAMIVDCCSQLRTYEKFFGLLGGRFCMLRKEFMECFERLFAQQYETIHRLETNKLRNVAKFFAHLIHSDSIPWSVFANIVLSEETTTSSSRIFIKILFQEITEYIGITKFNERLKDPTLAPFFEGLFPRDNPRNTRFSINFFTSIGLGGITDELREHLKVSAQLLSQKLQAEQLAALEAETSSDESSEDESSAEDSDKPKKRSKKSKKHKKKSSKKTKKRKSKKKEKKRKKSPTTPSSSDAEDSSAEEESDAEEEKSARKKVQDLQLDKRQRGDDDEWSRRNGQVMSRDSRSNRDSYRGDRDARPRRDLDRGYRDSNANRHDAERETRDQLRETHDHDRNHRDAVRDRGRDARESRRDHRDYSSRDERGPNHRERGDFFRSERDTRGDDRGRDVGRSDRRRDRGDENRETRRTSARERGDESRDDRSARPRDRRNDGDRRHEASSYPAKELDDEDNARRRGQVVDARDERERRNKRRDASPRSDRSARVRDSRKERARKQRRGSVSSSAVSSSDSDDDDNRKKRRGSSDRSVSLPRIRT